MKNIGQRIKTRRKQLNITQTQIQEQTSISSGNLSCIENGKYLPSAQALIELSNILNCSVDWILKGEPSISEFDKIIFEKEKKYLEVLRQLPEEEREEILEIMNMKLRRLKGDAEKMDKLSNLPSGSDNMVG